MLIRWTVVTFVCPPDWANLEGDPSYSYYYSGFYFAPQSEALVRWTMSVRVSGRLSKWEEQPSYSYYYSGFYFAPQSEALVRWTVRPCVSSARLRTLFLGVFAYKTQIAYSLPRYFCIQNPDCVLSPSVLLHTKP